MARHNELVDDFRKNMEALGIDTTNSNYFIGTFHKFSGEFLLNIDKDAATAYWGLPKEKKEKNSKFPDEAAFCEFLDEHCTKVTRRFDFIFIDEGHSLPDSYVKLLVNASKDGINGNVVYVQDDEQKIYGVKRDFKKAELLFKHDFGLLVNYRNTREISEFALKLTNKAIKTLKDKERLATTRSGSLPSLIYDNSPNKCAEKVYRKCSEWIEEGFEPFEIAIIYPKANLENPKALLLLIIDKFVENGKVFSLPYSQYRINKWFEQIRPGYVSSKKIISRPENKPDDLYNTVTLIPGFSSMGRSYKATVVIMDDISMQNVAADSEDNLLYIMLTRATHHLALAFVEATEYYKRARSILGLNISTGSL